MRDYKTLLNQAFDKWYNPLLKTLTDATRSLQENEFRYKHKRKSYDNLSDADYSFEKYSNQEGSFWDIAFQLLCPNDQCINNDVNVYQIGEEIKRREMPDLSMFKIPGSGGNVRAYIYARMKDFSIWNDPSHFVNISPDGDGRIPRKRYYLRGNLSEADLVDFLIAFCDFVPNDLDNRMIALQKAHSNLLLECKKAILLIQIKEAIRKATE